MMKKLLALATAALFATSVEAADIQSWSTTAGNNVLSSGTVGTGGINTDEGMAPDLVNNAIRDVMARLAAWRTGGNAIAGYWSGLVLGYTVQASIPVGTPALQVLGTTTSTAAVAVDGFNIASALRLYRSANGSVGSATVVANGDQIGLIGWYGAQQTATITTVNPAASISGEVDGAVTSGAGADMPGRLVFNTTPDGSGTLTERMRITSTGVLDLSQGTSGGIKFPGAGMSSADANTLDYYSEGQTTPTCTSGSGAFTTIACTVNYTRIGRQVMWSAKIVITTNGTAATYIALPVPFTSGAESSCSGIDIITGVAMACSMGAASTAVAIFKYDGTYPGVSGHNYYLQGTYNI